MRGVERLSAGRRGQPSMAIAPPALREQFPTGEDRVNALKWSLHFTVNSGPVSDPQSTTSAGPEVELAKAGHMEQGQLDARANQFGVVGQRDHDAVGVAERELTSSLIRRSSAQRARRRPAGRRAAGAAGTPAAHRNQPVGEEISATADSSTRMRTSGMIPARPESSAVPNVASGNRVTVAAMA